MPSSKPKKKIQNKVRSALRAKKIVRPSRCLLCKKESKVQAHHMDYRKPLSVMWLCARCHYHIHH